jgi:hypothetical protein
MATLPSPPVYNNVRLPFLAVSLTKAGSRTSGAAKDRFHQRDVRIAVGGFGRQRQNRQGDANMVSCESSRLHR